MIRKNLLKNLPRQPGVYLFKTRGGQVLYVGKARNLNQRIRSYFLPKLISGAKTQKLVEQIENVECLVVESEFEALLLEAEMIKKLKPKYNSRLKDDKSFLYIQMTKEDFPRVAPARKIEEGFGPFPHARTVRQILKDLRRIFPYRSCPRMPKKPCLFADLKLCAAPCSHQTTAKEYQKMIRHFKNLLQRKTSKVLKLMEKEMREQAQAQNFEKAAQARDKLEHLRWLLSSRQPIASYLENPDLAQDLRQKENRELGKIIGSGEVGRLEAYDISHWQGKKATGSLVVFLGGQPAKADYRRFRIRMKTIGDDPGMMKEMIKRRLNHPEWEKPDLILVDGGKGQISATLVALAEKGSKIPVIGLAKKEETLILPVQQKPGHGFRQISLPKDSAALNLLRRVRDEAHRFALAYHRRLRLFDSAGNPLLR